ncbi:protein Aster-B-like isoform X2 [Oratosquilla oratoria]|uniref:protein Aster-B-like isoform X2 n=1 Tax=Oratosquilla oratoria TaxID=337810 RepID=UPI003F75D267
MDSGSDRPGNGTIGSTGCNGSFQQHQHSPTNSAQDVHSAKSTQNARGQNHLQPQKNDLMWKSAENLCASGGGGPSTVQALAVSCGGIVTGSTTIVQGEGPNMRLVSSVSACPLGSNTSCLPAFNPNTNSLTPQHQHLSTSLHFPSSPAFVPDACGPNGSPSPYAETHTTVGPIDELTSSSQSVHVSQLDGDVRSSPCSSPKPSPRLILREASCDSSEDKLLQNDTIGSFSREGSLDQSFSDHLDQQPNEKLDSTSRSSESCRSLETGRGLGPDIGTNNGIPSKDRDRKESRDSKSSDKKSKKAWYSMLSPTYKSRSEDLKRLFKDLPSDERLIVDYSCALQKDILVHGRLYVTPNFFCFYSKIFGWETVLTIRCKDIVTMSKEKTALVIPNALQVSVDNEKHFFTSFTARDKTYLMLFRIWQNALMDQQMSPTELWQWVHSCYGDELGLTSDDDDYVAPSTEDDTKNMSCTDRESVTMTAPMKMYNVDSTEDASQVECSLDDGGHTRSEPPVAREPHYPVEPSSRSPAKSLHHTISPNKHSTGQPGGPGTQSPDVIPTDLSDTTESEANNSIVAGEIVVCPNASSHHLGRELMNAVYSLPVDTVFTLIFANSKFMLDIYTARKTYDVVSSPWQSNSDTNQKLRQVTYTMTLPPNSFGPKVSHVTETQVVSPFSKPGEMYTVDVEACNAGIPYADSFYISNHWCLTRESSSETRVSVWTQVKYKKNVWGFMKGVIDKNAYIGIESLMQDMNAALLVEVDRSNQKRTRRRRRRAGSKVETADSTNPSQAEKGKDMHKSTQIPSRKMLTMQSACLETSAAPAEGPIRIVLLTLIGLLVVNALLYYRLWALEEKVNYPSSSMHSFPALDPNIFRQGSGKGSWEDWVAILHQQEAQHSTEIERWRKSIEEAARFLKQAEEALQNLHASIPPHHASKIQSLLKQVQALQESQDESSPLHTSSLHSTPSSSSPSSKSSSSSHHSPHLHSTSHMYPGGETAETPEGIKVDWERKREL